MGGHEGDEGREDHHKDWPGRGHCLGHGAEEVGLRQGAGQLGRGRDEEVKKTGKVTIPGLCMIKTRVKPATKAGKREMFGQVVMVSAKPAKTVVKAYPVAAIKKAI